MKKVFNSDRYGKILYEESFWTGKKRISINDKVMTKLTKQSFQLKKDEDFIKAFVIGNLFKGVVLTVDEERFEVYSKTTWYEYIFVIFTMLLVITWGNIPSLCAIVPVVGGAIGGAISGVFVTISLFLTKYIKPKILKILTGIGMSLASFLTCAIIGTFLVIAVTYKPIIVINDFINSQGLESDVYALTEKDDDSVKKRIGLLTVGDNGFQIDIIDDLGSIIYLEEENKLFYHSEDNKYYTTDEMSKNIDLMNVVFKTINDDDLMNYIKNFSINGDTVEFEIDIKKMILNNYEKKDRKEIDNTINFSTVKCYVTIKFNKVTEFYMDISPILESLDEEDNFKFNKVIIGINNITYDDFIEIAPVKLDYYQYKNNQLFYDLFIEKMNKKDEVKEQIYQLGTYKSNYTVIKDIPNITLEGYIYDKYYNFVYFSECLIKGLESIDFFKIGETRYTIGILYHGCEFSIQITVNVIDVKYNFKTYELGEKLYIAIFSIPS